uniref:Tetraspanin family n=1 Tax=Schistocephalus solidus TaxID=70667 RepID=A0A0X3NLU3_SCHSO
MPPRFSVQIMQMAAEYIDGKIINEYKSDSAVRDMIDYLQNENKCCGGSDFRVYEDVWRSMAGNGGSVHLPLSCCSESDCVVYGNVSSLKGIFQQGCFVTLENTAKHEVNGLSVTLLVFGILTLALSALVFWELCVTRPTNSGRDAVEYLDCEEKSFSIPPDLSWTQPDDQVEFGDLTETEQGVENPSRSGVC